MIDYEIYNRKHRFYPVFEFILLASAVVIRPDSGFFLCIFATSILLRAINDIRKEKRLPSLPLWRSYKKEILGLSSAFFIVMALLLWQKSFYGDFLPNTYYLKTSHNARSLQNGAEYFISGLFIDGLLPVLILSLIGSCFYIKKTKRVALIIAGTILSWCFYIIWTGGDAMPHGRYFVVILPLLYLMAAVALQILWDKSKEVLTNYKKTLTLTQALSSLAFILLSILLLLMQSFALRGISFPVGRFTDRIAVIESLKKSDLPPNTTIAVYEAGINFFLPQYKFHDLLGKNDRHIALSEAKPGLVGHNKWDYEYSLGLIKPDIIICRDGYSELGYLEAFYIVNHPELLPPNSVFFSLALYVHPQFNDYYVRNRLHIETPFNSHWVYLRNGFVTGENIPVINAKTLLTYSDRAF